MKTWKELNKIVEDKYNIEEGLWFDFSDIGRNLDFSEGEALAILLKEEVVWINNYEDGDRILIRLFVNTNDVFAWGMGDAEELEWTEIEPLIKLFLDNEQWGPTKWACIFKNMKPQGPIIRDMKKDGYWDEELESLPDNVYDSNTIDL